MTKWDNMTLKEIIEIDCQNVYENLLKGNEDRLSYDKDCCAWFLDGEEIVDELYYDVYTILHPKEIIGYIEEIIEDKMGLKK